MSLQKQRQEKNGGFASSSDEEAEQHAIVKPTVKIQDALEDLRSFEQMKSRLLSKSDYQPIQGKNFIKKSGWRKLALVFNISDEVVDQKRLDRSDGSFVWSFRVRATAPNGRYTESVASCDSKERKFSHLEHDVFATANTRAKSRAISDLIGAGEVSAEEMTFDSDDSLDDLEGVHQDLPETMESLGIPSAKKIAASSSYKDKGGGPQQSVVASIPSKVAQSTSLDNDKKSVRRFELRFEGKPYPIGENEEPFTKFFINKICRGIAQNNPPASFALEKDDHGQVIAVVWKYLDGEKMAREISNTLDWTLRKVSEIRKKNTANLV